MTSKEFTRINNKLNEEIQWLQNIIENINENDLDTIKILNSKVNAYNSMLRWINTNFVPVD